MTSTPASVEIVDLDSPDLAFNSYAIAGSDVAADLAMLHADDSRAVRAVLVAFPDGWRREGTGHQPAAEEMVVLSGALSMSGQTCDTEHLLSAAPHATRSATSVLDGTRAVVWFAGAPGGWQEGAPSEPGVLRVLPLAPGTVRAPVDGLIGSVEVREDVAGATFDVDADLVWPGSAQYAHLPAGTPAPQVPGRVVVRLWG